MNSKLGIRLGIAATMVVAVGFSTWFLSDRFCDRPRAVQAGEPEGREHLEEKAADNSMCYVCHLTLETEQITTIHQQEGCGCTNCHGPSRDHMHDEMLMTTPDLKYGRRQVEAMCRECHKEPHQGKEDEVKEFLENWRGKERPNGRAITEKSICTDCHGTHNIDKGLTAEKDRPKPAAWVAAFNGKDLTGWRVSGDAEWKIEPGRIVATPGPKGGDLWTEAEYEDYLMAVTFRTDWPIHAGIWLRAGNAQPGPRVEIFRHEKPMAFTGSVGLPGKGLVLANLREELFDAGGWNTLSVEVRGSRVGVWLNGEEVGAVCCAMAERGRIGLHLNGGSQGQRAKITVREVQIQRLPEEKGE